MAGHAEHGGEGHGADHSGEGHKKAKGHDGGHDAHGAGGHSHEKAHSKESFRVSIIKTLRGIFDLPSLIKFAADRGKILYETVKGGMTTAPDVVRKSLVGSGGGGHGGGHGHH